MPMLFALGCETLSHFLSCVRDSMHHYWLSSRLGCEESGRISAATFQVAPLVARLNLHGTLLTAVCDWIFQVF
jgi:hypothetical protein